MNQAKQTKIYQNILCYGLIVIVSLLSCYLFFLGGISNQDDIYFHLTQSYDVYYGLKNGFFGLSTNHLAMGAFGYNTYLFYGPFPHYLVAFTYLFTEWMGSSLIGCYKFVVMMSMIVSGIYTYLLGMKVSIGSKAISVAGAAIYILSPYRIFCIFCRGAFAESIGMAFIPMLFYGLYRILNDEKFYVSPFVNTVLGVVLLVLSHPFTALLTVIFAVIYLLCNIIKIIHIFKRKHTVVFTLCSMVLIIGLVFFYVMPTLQAKNSGIYIVCDSGSVWTTLEHVASSTNSSRSFSGFLNNEWISGQISNGTWVETYSLNYLIIGGVIGLFSAVLMMIADYFIQKAPKSKYYRFIVDLIVLFLMPLIIYRRLEVILGLAVYYLVFILVMILKDHKEIEKAGDKKEHIYKNPDIYFLIISSIVLLVFIFKADVWKYVPSIFYQCQFAWREWSLFNFFVDFLIIYCFSYLNQTKFKGTKYAVAALSMLNIVFFSFNQAYIEKRVKYELDGGYEYSLVDEEFTSNVRHEGAMNEYLPLVFSDETYTSKFSNSLYKSVRYALDTQSNFITTPDKYNSSTYCPRSLEGKATVKATVLKTPEVTLSASVSEANTLIQIPQFYYDGYQVKLINQDTNSSSTMDAIATDGLVSFKVAEAGNYTVEVKYTGTKAYRLGKYLFVVSLVGLIALGSTGLALRKKDEKEDHPENSLTKNLKV